MSRTAVTVPIFDSLTHPSLDGSWISATTNANSFPNLVSDLRDAGASWAWAVSMGTTDGYDIQAYAKECSKYEIELFPAAYVDLDQFPDLAATVEWLLECKRLGFLGIKLHPRFGGFDFAHPLLAGTVRSASSLGLTVILCTYFYSSRGNPYRLSVESLGALLREVRDARIILAHAGGVRLLEMGEITRHFKNTLLDLSWTLCEYSGSSVDDDLRYLLDRGRSRVCIGSDSPSFSPLEMRERFEQLTDGFDLTHKRMIASENLRLFTGLGTGDGSRD